MTINAPKDGGAAFPDAWGNEGMSPCQNHHFGSPGDLVGKTNLEMGRLCDE